MALIVNYAETIIPNGEFSAMSTQDRDNLVSVASWSTSRDISDSANCIFLLCQNHSDLHRLLRSTGARVEAVKIPTPDRGERLKFIRYFDAKTQTAGRNSGLRFKEGFNIDLFANLTSGLTRLQIEDLTKQAVALDVRIGHSFVWEHKKAIIEAQIGDLVEIIDPQWGWEVIGGLVRNKQLMIKIANSLKTGYLEKVPVGILALGPPGTGKTVFAEAFAKQVGFTMLKLKAVKEMWVGSSERNWNRVEELIRSLEPVIIFEDEADDQNSVRSTGPSLDAEVTESLRARKMAFMSDTSLRGKVLWFAASNRPDRMDPALKRPGRFDVKLFFPPPNEEEIREIFPAIFQKIKLLGERMGREIRIEISEEEVLGLSKDAVAKNATGAEIERICHRALQHTDDGAPLKEADIKWALEDTLKEKGREDDQEMTELALLEVNSRELLDDFWLAKRRELLARR